MPTRQAHSIAVGEKPAPVRTRMTADAGIVNGSARAVRIGQANSAPTIVNPMGCTCSRAGKGTRRASSRVPTNAQIGP